MQTENNTAALKKLSFSTLIQATKEKVWKVLWDDETYRAWTSAFSEGSHAVSDWNEGSKILFLDGKGSGMYSTIARKIPAEFMSFRHIGEVKDGVEQPLNEKTKAWSGGTENYTLKESDGKTELLIELDIVDEFMEYFKATFPKALEKIKEIAESRIKITVNATVNAPVEKVWSCWTEPMHITKWNNASDEWHTPHATNDLRAGGRFLSRMEAKDGSFGFDFEGGYTKVATHEKIDYTMADGRKVSISFSAQEKGVEITETFEAEDENSIELQQGGWQAILNNFKKYTEAN